VSFYDTGIASFIPVRCVKPSCPEVASATRLERISLVLSLLLEATTGSQSWPALWDN
jgi:hypothetical protein